MEISIQKLAQMAGVSSRTLRYYDETGLLKPLRISSSGYRIYGGDQIDRLQHILFYRELGLELDRIKALLDQPAFDAGQALRDHRAALLDRRNQLDRLIETVEKSIAYNEGRFPMTSREKFEGFKKTMVDTNEKQFGKEVRDLYGDDVVNKSNQKLQNMTEVELDAAQALSEAILIQLGQAMDSGDPASPQAQAVADMHKRWLGCYWPTYNKEMHAGLASMYVEDERFTAFYDEKVRPGAAVFLRDAIHHYTGQK
jgi:DNA-binding transcriptional MerR regulator